MIPRIKIPIHFAWHGRFSYSQSSACGSRTRNNPIYKLKESLWQIHRKLVNSDSRWGRGGPSDFSQAAQDKKLEGLRTALSKGVSLLQSGASAIDVAQQVVQVLEDDPNFNAGKGAVYNSEGNVSLDASLMNGADLTCGAVANVTVLKIRSSSHAGSWIKLRTLC